MPAFSLMKTNDMNLIAENSQLSDVPKKQILLPDRKKT